VHPVWCERNACEERGEHQSPWLPVNSPAAKDESAEIHVALGELFGDDMPAPRIQLIWMRVTEEERTVSYLLPVGQARLLRHQLERLLDWATGRHADRRRGGEPL
jgi:hypothetical protein